MSLNARQQRFVEEYLKDLNGKQAAIRAGYSAKTAEVKASQLLSVVKVSEAVAKAKAERAARIHVDQDYVLKKIVETVERCSQAVPVFDRQGNPVMVETPTGQVVPAYAFDAMAVLKGTDQLAKHVGLFEKDNKQKTDPLRDLLGALSGNIVGVVKQTETED